MNYTGFDAKSKGFEFYTSKTIDEYIVLMV